MYTVDHFVVEHIAVVPRWRRRGAGRALLEAAHVAALERDLHLLTLTVWNFNRRAQSFFAETGYQPYALRMWRRTDEPPADPNPDA